MKVIKAFLGPALLAASSLASASPIYYAVESLGDDRWQYNYTVGNETGADIDWFTIWFDPSLYAFDTDVILETFEFYDTEEEEWVTVEEWVTIVDEGTFSGPAGWDMLAAAPDPFFPGPADDAFGFYDGLALVDPIASGSEVSGFSMIFTWLGDNTPGSQPFTLYGDDLQPVFDDNLFTEPLVGPVPVSEPGTLGLLGASFALLGFARRTPARG